MSKKKRLKMWDKKKNDLTIYELRWECMRRSKEYIDDYNNYRRTCDGLYKGKDFDSLKAYEIQQTRFFVEKYRIVFPLDPNISVWQPVRTISIGGSLPTHVWNMRKPRLIANFLSYWIKGAICLDSNKPYSGVIDQGTLSIEELKKKDLIRHLKKRRYTKILKGLKIGEEAEREGNIKRLVELKKKDNITILIDLDAPLPTIKKEVEKIVTEWQGLRSKIVPKPKILTKPKRFECKKHLEVYDDFHKNGGDWDRLARKFYKPLYNVVHTRNYAKQKAKRNYDMAVKLIEEGEYRHIR